MTTSEAIALDTQESKQLLTPSDLDRRGVVEIAGELKQLLADVLCSTSRRRTSIGT